MTRVVSLIAGALLSSRSPSIETYLHMREPGQAAFTPDGRTAVVQVFSSPLTARTFDNEALYDAQRSRLLFIDVGRRRLRRWRKTFRALPGPFSPAGSQMAVLRPRDHALQLGLIRLADHSVRWLPISVEPSSLGRTLQWRSEGELVVLSPARGAVAELLQAGAAAETRMEHLWARQRFGRSASVSQLFPTRPLSDGPRRLLVVTVGSGTSRRIASGPITDFELSPDGRVAALLSLGDPRHLSTALSLTVAEHLRQTDLSILEISTGQRRAACGGDTMPTLLSWSARSTTLLAAWRSPDDFSWSRPNMSLVGRRGSCTKLIAPTATLDPLASNGEGLPVIEAGWRDGRPLARLSLDGRPAHWLVLSASEPPMEVAPPPPVDAEAFTGAARLALVAPKAHTEAGRSEEQLLACNDSGRLILETGENGVSSVRLRTAAADLVIARLNGDLARIRWAKTLSLRSSTGTHWLYLPPQVASPPPLVILPYPGAAYETAPAAYRPGSSNLVTQAQLLAAKGYAALVPSLAPPGPGRADAGIAAGILAALKVASASGLVDAGRVALWGHSFGGYAALVAAEASPSFRLVIADHAPLDLISSRGVAPTSPRAFDDFERYLEFQYGWTEGGQAGFGATPQRAGAAYLDASAVTHADRLTAPVLLINGDQDFVTPGQAEEMAAALQRYSKPVQLLTFWGEGHVLLSPANLRESYRRTFSALDAALGASSVQK